MIARKVVDVHIEGEYEIKKTHLVDIPVKEIDIAFLEDIFDDDEHEEAQSAGICFDSTGDIFCIDIDEFVAWGTNYYKEWVGDTDFGLVAEDVKNLLDILEKYKGYTLMYLQEKEVRPFFGTLKGKGDD